MSDTRNTVERFFAAFGASDLDAVKSLFAENFKFLVHGGPKTPWAGERTRRDELDAFFEAFNVLGPPTEYTVRHILVDGEHAVALGRNAFPVESTGKRFTNDFALHFVVQNNRIVEYQMYEDTHAIHEAFDD